MSDLEEIEPEAKTARLTLRMSMKVKARIEKLMERMDAADEGEVIRRALAVYEEIISIAEDHDIVARDDEGKEVTLRFL